MPSFQLETQPPGLRRLACDPTQAHQSLSPDHVNCKEVPGVQSFEKGTPVLPVAKLPIRLSAGGTEKVKQK